MVFPPWLSCFLVLYSVQIKEICSHLNQLAHVGQSFAISPRGTAHDRVQMDSVNTDWVPSACWWPGLCIRIRPTSFPGGFSDLPKQTGDINRHSEDTEVNYKKGTTHAGCLGYRAGSSEKLSKTPRRGWGSALSRRWASFSGKRLNEKAGISVLVAGTQRVWNS